MALTPNAMQRTSAHKRPSMTPRDSRPLLRRKALARIRSRFIAKGHPRALMFVFVALAGLAAFGFSVTLFRLGVDHMGFRYLGATAAGYAVFLLLLRVWIAFHRREDPGDPDIPDFDMASTDADAEFSGGSSGGGGASGSWDGPGLPDVDIPDADEAWPVVVAIAIAGLVLLGAAAALFYVVYYAPLLLAEVALDAALVTGIYRRLRKHDTRYWLTSAIRHTWKPALAIALCVYVIGTLVQWAMPTAQTIGDVLR